jgi:hypothetical protein
MLKSEKEFSESNHSRVRRYISLRTLFLYQKEGFSVKEFDLLFYKGEGIVSNVIKKVTKSDYSHVALVLDDYHLLEADWKKPLSIRHFSYRAEDYDIYRVEGLMEEHKDRLRRYIVDTINSPYDFALIASHLLNYFFKGKIVGSPNRFDCSEWIDLAFLYAGVDLLPGIAFSTITPEKLVKSPKIKLVKP